MEDFVARGFRTLPDGPTTTEVLCKWSRPAGDKKVEAVPISKVIVRKAVSGGKKRQTKWDRSHSLSKYDPRFAEVRRPCVAALKKLKLKYVEAVGDCEWIRLTRETMPELHEEQQSEAVPVHELPDSCLDHDLPVCSEQEVPLHPPVSEREYTTNLIAQRQQQL